jgi:DHA1 family tetracycline resistance protein-like MFS transporter
MSKIKSPLLPIFLIVVVDILGLTIILPLLPFYAERLGATPRVVGLLVSTYALCQLIAGRKPLLLVSQVGTFIGFLILANAASLAIVFLSRVIDGLTAGNLSLAQAYIADVTEPQDRAKAFGVIGVAFGLGFLVGPGISGYLSQFGFQYPIYAAAGLSATSILATYLLLPSESTVHRHPDADNGPVAPGGKRLAIFDWANYLDYFRRPELGVLLAQFFLFAFSFALFTSGFALFAERRYTHAGLPFGPKQVGYVFAYAGFLGILLQGGIIGRLVKRFGEEKVIAQGFFASTLGYGILGASRTIPTLLGASTVSSFGSSALRPALTSLVTQRVGRHEQGVVLGLTQSLMSVAQIVAPLIAGMLIENGLLSSWAWLAGGVALYGLILATSRKTLEVKGNP